MASDYPQNEVAAVQGGNLRRGEDQGLHPHNLLVKLQQKMFRATAILAILASAAAFAPMGRMATSSALKMSFESELGAQPPLGFWDPLGLLNDADQERFDRLRTVETKHGRISMLAILGHIVTTAGARVPLGPNEVKTGLAVFDTLPTAGLAVTFLTIGAIELGFASIKDELEDYCSSTYPDIAEDRRKAVELNNGRAAQMGILALMVHEKLDNNPYMINSLLGAPVTF